MKMKLCQIKNKTRSYIVAEKVEVASDFCSRLVGLMFRKNIGKYDGMLINRCNSIHTCFMNFRLDVIFLNKEKKVVKIVRNIPPWRMTSLFLKASDALELEGNYLEGKEIEIGDEIEVLCLN